MNTFIFLLLMSAANHVLFDKVASNVVTDGCNRDMRLFGPNNQYRCNCKELASCDFKNNGKCINGECSPGFEGPHCQIVLYHMFMKNKTSKNLEIFTNHSTKIQNKLQISFYKKIKINQLKMNCKTSNRKFSIFIGNTKFCEISCSETVYCTDDITGENMIIKTDQEIEISNVEIIGCSTGWFGEKCDKQCHCANNRECHQINGSCPMGCENGRSGSDCQTLNYVNVALNKNASQSSTENKGVILVNGTCKEQHFNFSANLAVDGNTDQISERLSCMQTKSEQYSKWSVSLGKQYSIKHIRIYNSNSEKSKDLTEFTVCVGDKLCKTITDDIIKGSKIVDIPCSRGLRGNSITIKNDDSSKASRSFLQICEVEVLQCAKGFYGDNCNNTCPECKNSSCNQWTGQCLSGCASGFFKQINGRKCIAEIQDLPKSDDIWDEGHKVSTKITEGCGANMRLFGPNNQYQCNCKELQSCDFGDNGKCKTKECNFGYRGQFCQKIVYHEYLKRRISQYENVFTNVSIAIKDSLNISFVYRYRINLIRINCKSSVSEAKISLYIGSTKFCEEKCLPKVKCIGDVTGKFLFISGTSGISVSGMKVYGCSPGWFGEKCDKQCHCADGDECHKITGNCPKGCESGRRGPHCQTLNYENVAKNKSASQSSTYQRSLLLSNDTCKTTHFSFSADLAVDGNTDQQHERKACSHTHYKRYQYWQVDLGKKYNISQIRIYNRNFNMDRLKYAKISVDNNFCFMIYTAKKIIDIKCRKVILGQIIKFEKDWIIQLCEVEVLQCLHGFYGDKCNKTCPECKNSTCDQWTGQCLSGCAPGYFNKTCKACPFGKFGELCSQTCHCKNNSNCIKETGVCKPEGCIAGYLGDNCQQPCPLGKFGEKCVLTCHCNNNINCNKEDGTCESGRCADGYIGYNCQKPCPFGKFGEQCSQTCHCKNNSNCIKETGVCKPKGCTAGYFGDSCQQPCQLGTFGEGCTQKCHCKNNINCNKKNGTCGSEGCATGYKGHNCQEKKIPIFIPIIIGITILLIIAAGVAIYMKFRNLKKESHTSLSQPKASLEKSLEMDSVIGDEEDTGPMENHENIYMNHESVLEEPMELTKDNILSYVQNKKMEDLPFAEEFLKLPKGLIHAHNAAQEDKNKSKNRYKTILPYDHSRVQLHPDEHSSSDYINANYLTEDKTYIATQGPLSSTISDFWRMVHQNKCNVIVMLTNLSKNDKLKSEQYWPELEVTKTYETISVSNKVERKHSYYIYRQFCITKNSENFLVEHYQFTSWPDHGAPKDPEYFIAFRNKVRSTPFYKPPILVHCSGGVGRSGSYIILDIILEEMKSSSKIDVIGWILKLRKDRTLMVQKRSQLEFIYDVLVENITTGPTMVYISKLPQVYNQLLKFPKRSSSSYMELQFKKFILPFNKKENSVMYDNENYIEDDENYVTPIDFTMLTGNNLEEEFILMSTPSEEKYADFWNIIFLKKCTLLVMFDEMPSKAASYWPEKDSIGEYKHFTVKLVEEQDHDSYIKRTLKVSSSKLNMPELLVHFFQIRIWLSDEFPSPKEIVEIIQTIQSLQMNQSTKQLTLHCLDGISKNGLFCVLYMIIEILQRDSSINIVQLIRLLKKREKEIIPDYISYHYCWFVAKVYQEELSLYVNESNMM